MRNQWIIERMNVVKVGFHENSLLFKSPFMSQNQLHSSVFTDQHRRFLSWKDQTWSYDTEHALCHLKFTHFLVFQWNSSHFCRFTTQQVSFILLSISIFFMPTMLQYWWLNQTFNKWKWPHKLWWMAILSILWSKFTMKRSLNILHKTNTACVYSFKLQHRNH